MCVANEVLRVHSVNYLVVAGLGPENALESIAVENAWKITINNRHDSRNLHPLDYANLLRHISE